jgi:nicotinamide-nucleotide amidase
MERVVKKLIELNKTISTMESCTGGGIANAITNIPDASKVIKFSAVTYSNEFKIKMGVNEELINKYSVYSMEVASDMAKKISEFTNSNYGVGVTGKLKKIDENNMFGDDDLVYLSIYDKDNNKYYNKKIKLDFDTRTDNKNQIIDEFIELFLNIE